MLGTTVEGREDRTCGDLEVALLQFLSQAGGVVRQVAVRTQFDPLVAGLRNLIKKPFPRSLLGIIREPDAPGIRGGADDQLVLNISHDGVVFLCGGAD
ncbi:hypothetical protein D3C87_1964880 [compost metagenome]